MLTIFAMQYLLNDFVNRLVDHILTHHRATSKPVTKESVIEFIPTLCMDTGLVKYALEHIEKNKDNESKPLFAEGLKAYLEETHSDFVDANEEGCLTIINIIEYLLQEILELSGNCASNVQLLVHTPYTIRHAIEEDEELLKIFEMWVFGTNVSSATTFHNYPNPMDDLDSQVQPRNLAKRCGVTNDHIGHCTIFY